MLALSIYPVQLSELPQLQFRPTKREPIQVVLDVNGVAMEVHKVKSHTAEVAVWMRNDASYLRRITLSTTEDGASQ